MPAPRGKAPLRVLEMNMKRYKIQMHLRCACYARVSAVCAMVLGLANMISPLMEANMKMAVSLLLSMFTRQTGEATQINQRLCCCLHNTRKPRTTLVC